MFITNKALSRRTILRGVGATLALPVLEAMVPAFGARAVVAATPTRRFGAVFVPLGERPGFWEPAQVGANFELSTIMKPLEKFQSHMTVVSQLCDPLDGHATTVAAWLSGAIPKRTLAENVHAGVTVDQVIADQIGQDTPMRSLELATEDFTGWIGGCDPSYSCAYMNTISWKNATTPMPMEINPRSVFERMFGRPGTAAQRKARMATDRSVLDSLLEELGGLKHGLSGKDANRLNDYTRECPRDRAAHPEGRAAVGEQRRGPRRAGGHPRGVRGPRGADVRPDGAGLRGRPHAGRHLHEVARRQPARLPEDRRHRAAPRDVAPREQSREARQPGEGEHAPRGAVREVRREARRRRPTATARCSTTP